MIDTTSGRELVDKIPTEAQTLISTMVINSQQFDTRIDLQGKVNEVPLTLILNKK